MKIIGRYHLVLALCLGIGTAITLIAVNLFADAPPPGLTISSLGSNQFLVTVTNSVSTTNYTLFWTPALGDSAEYPWEAISTGAVGQASFTISGGGYQVGFFQVALISSSGVPPWEAADPSNPNSPILSVNIVSPADGSVVQ